MGFTLNTKQLLKIWFSTDCAIFMNLTNQLRMIRFCNWNKNAHITLIYSSKMLNTQAKQDLLRFCKYYSISPLDFDTELKNDITENGSLEEKELFQIAQNELENILTKNLGDVAAASDIVRILRPVLRKGIYSDLDCEFDFSKLPEKLTIKGPALLNMASTGVFLGLSVETIITNDFIGLSEEHYFSTEEDLLHRAQKKIILNYKNLKFTFENFLGSLSSALNKKLNNYMDRKKPTTIFEYRKFLIKYITVEMLFYFFCNDVVEKMDKEEIETTNSFIDDLNTLQKTDALSKKEYINKVANCFIRNFVETNRDNLYGEKILSLFDTNQDLVEEFITLILMNIQKSLILTLSGPKIMSCIFGQMSIVKMKNWDIYHIEDCYAIYKNPLLVEFSEKAQFVCTKKKIKNLESILTDFYWIEAHKKTFDEKERKMVESARLIQTAYRRYKHSANYSVRSENSTQTMENLIRTEDDVYNEPQSTYCRKPPGF